MNLDSLTQSLAETLALAPGLATTDILHAYPTRSHLPLTSPAIILAIEALELNSSGLSGFSERYPLTVTARFDIFCPGEDGSALNSLYHALCAALIRNADSYGLGKIWCRPIAWDNAAGSYKLTARALLRGLSHSSAPQGNDGPLTPITGFTLTRKDDSDDLR